MTPIEYDFKVEVMKYERVVWSHRLDRYVTRRHWNLQIDDRYTYVGFRTKREAFEYVEHHLAGGR